MQTEEKEAFCNHLFCSWKHCQSPSSTSYSKPWDFIWICTSWKFILKFNSKSLKNGWACSLRIKKYRHTSFQIQNYFWAVVNLLRFLKFWSICFKLIMIQSGSLLDLDNRDLIQPYDLLNSESLSLSPSYFKSIIKCIKNGKGKSHDYHPKFLEREKRLKKIVISKLLNKSINTALFDLVNLLKTRWSLNLIQNVSFSHIYQFMIY